ncbi:PGF-CTERM sorting domain-containing protein [Halogeometricum borinquense]|uniref:PGF-CTERM sorting domain-containing protein n=1 Tax=Halogeometricum borinquense TaxID=60847 RepID=UPI003413FEC0
MKRIIALMAATLVIAAAVPATGAAAAADAQSSAYTGTHVEFDTESNAVTNYSVGGTMMLDSLRVESAESSGDTGIDVDASVSTEADIAGSSLSISATAEASADVTTESGATLTAHDTPNGNLVVTGTESQVVRANVSEDATVTEDGEARVVVENGNTTGVFIAVGNASVAKNDDGDVSARVESDGRVVFRSYGENEERTENDREAERLVANGTATAEVYVTDEGDNRSSEVVHYGSNTTVNVTEQSTETVNITVERAVSEGAVVLTSVSEKALNASDSLEVTVDGQAAAEVESTSELRTAADGGNQSAYMIADGSADADAETDVYIALNHFSERKVTMQSADNESTTTETATESTETETNTTATESTDTETETDTDSTATTSDDTSATENESATEHGSETTESSTPGFGVTAALVALAGSALLIARRR